VCLNLSIRNREEGSKVEIIPAELDELMAMQRRDDNFDLVHSLVWRSTGEYKEEKTFSFKPDGRTGSVFANMNFVEKKDLDRR